MKLVESQQGTIRNIVKSYEIEAVICETSRLFKVKDSLWLGVKELMRSRCPVNNSRCFKCNELELFKKACCSRSVKSIEKASNISNIASNSVGRNNNKSSISRDKSYFLKLLFGKHKFNAHKLMVNVLVDDVNLKFRIGTEAHIIIESNGILELPLV